MEQRKGSSVVVAIFLVVMVITIALSIARAYKSEPQTSRMNVSQPTTDIPVTSDFTVLSSSWCNGVSKITAVKDNKTSIEYLIFTAANGIAVVKRDGGSQ